VLPEAPGRSGPGHRGLVGTVGDDPERAVEVLPRVVAPLDPEGAAGVDDARLRAAAAGHGLRFSVHAPWAADPARPEGSASIRRSLDVAADVAANTIVVHLSLDLGVKAFADALGPLLRAARDASAVLAPENTPLTAPEDVNAVFRLLATMPEGEGRVGICLDSGHANLHPGTRNDYLGFVDRLGVHVPIVHWHAHENRGDQDTHLPLFTGPSARDDSGLRGLNEQLRQRGFCGSVVLEQWPWPPELLVEARDWLRRLWDSMTARGGPRTGSEVPGN
jgi:sugar phosphate isomerase/epimerase